MINLTAKIIEAKDLLTKRDFEGARLAVRSVLDKDKFNYQALTLMCELEIACENIGKAKGILKILIQQRPQELQFSIKLAQIHIDEGDFEEAPKVFDPLFKLFNHPDLFFNHAWFLTRAAKYTKAIEQYEKAISLKIDFPEEVYLNIANIYSNWLANSELARINLNKSLAINSNYIDAIYNLGNLEEDLGNRENAIRQFKRVVSLYPSHGSASARLALATNDRDCNNLISELRNLIKNPNINQNALIDCHYALGKLYDQSEHYEKAFESWELANKLNKSQNRNFDSINCEGEFNELISKYNKEYIDTYSLDNSIQPIFISGMFRSGSTLLEQILASHSQIKAGGELDFFTRCSQSQKLKDNNFSSEKKSYLKNIMSDYIEVLKRHGHPNFLVTDKRPDNILHLGLIKMIFPKSKFLITKRAIMDNCISIFSNRFSDQMIYTWEIRDIEFYYKQVEKLVSHWQTMFNEDIYIVDYDKLIKNPKNVIMESLAFLGLDWQEDCLNFYKLNNSVQTASTWQVREPLYKKASGRWKNYKNVFEKNKASVLNI